VIHPCVPAVAGFAEGARSKGVPARLRCGFATYFGSGWEDHWVCEYWDKQVQTWRLSDPQIDRVLNDRCRIGFDPKDVPRQCFAMAGEAWLDCRGARSDPNLYGHGKITGSEQKRLKPETY
jgi:hypothetical protein